MCIVPEQTGPVWDITTQCSIPNESKNGTCTLPIDCPAYATINNPEDVSSVGRLSFLKKIQCSSAGTDGICCPRSKRYQWVKTEKPTVIKWTEISQTGSSQAGLLEIPSRHLLHTCYRFSEHQRWTRRSPREFVTRRHASIRDSGTMTMSAGIRALCRKFAVERSQILMNFPGWQCCCMSWVSCRKKKTQNIELPHRHRLGDVWERESLLLTCFLFYFPQRIPRRSCTAAEARWLARTLLLRLHIA